GAIPLDLFFQPSCNAYLQAFFKNAVPKLCQIVKRRILGAFENSINTQGKILAIVFCLAKN
ncbi:hypothetical protein, partial [Helicobacter sp. 11S02596-1]|uniref:hypothetical protein n=1 Tax=Helicobacter sp. 11S02596-1 TaxID=1476194 RepID=UPI0015DE4E62